MSRGSLETNHFDYSLEEDRIAKYPLTDRGQSKLLVYQDGEIQESVFKELRNYLPNNTSLVFNDTKVMAARLRFENENGAKIEVFCLEPYQTTAEQALVATHSCEWTCMVGNLKRFKDDQILELAIAGTTLKASKVVRKEQEVIIQFDWEGGITFSEILNEAGEVPLPPYLNRDTEASDKDNYQTVYAKQEGAVAAPTAGLHFTNNQLLDLQSEGHELAYLTLHVGAGTFRPVKADKLVEHQMHEERIVVSKATLAQLCKRGRKIVSVGTTSLRSLESMYWLAVKMNQNPTEQIHHLGQEDAYELKSDWNWKEAFEFLLEWMGSFQVDHLDFHSSLFIMPGYEWKVIDGLITNFHQPKSTLLALVSSWIGQDWKRVYDYALSNDFRFLSYGDSSLLWKKRL